MYHSSKSSATGHLIFIRHGQQNKEKDSERTLTDRIYCELNLFFHFCFLDGQQITCQRYQLLQSFPKELPKAIRRRRSHVDVQNYQEKAKQCQLRMANLLRGRPGRHGSHNSCECGNIGPCERTFQWHVYITTREWNGWSQEFAALQ